MDHHFRPIAQLQVVGLEISKTQISHENINKSGYKNPKNERHVRIKDMHIIRDFIAPDRESFLTTTYP